MVRAGDERLIQCYHHAIILNNLKASCIKRPFSVPLSETVEIANFTHRLETVEVAAVDESDEQKTVRKGELDQTFEEGGRTADENYYFA